MSAVYLRRIAMHLVIALFFLDCWATSGATAGCKGWTVKSVCANSTDAKGAYCDEAECNCGPRFNETPTSYTVRCANPGWACNWGNWAWYCSCQQGIFTDENWTYVDSSDEPAECVDGDTQACQVSDGCPGTKKCTNCEWEPCQQNEGICCLDPNGGSGN